MSADLHKNCKSFSIASDGMLTGVCNAVKRADNRGNVWYETKTKTIDLDDEVGNEQSKEKTLTCGRSAFSTYCRNLSVSIHAKGVDLTGECIYHVDGKTTWPSKTINLNDGIKCDTSNGDLTSR